MGRRKKLEGGSGVVDWASRAQKLEKELKIAQICSSLLQADNPFSVEIKDAEILDYLKMKFKVFIMNLTETDKDQNQTLLDFTDEEVAVLKGWATKILNKVGRQRVPQQVIVNQPTAPAQPVSRLQFQPQVQTQPAAPTPQNKNQLEIDFEMGDLLLSKKEMVLNMNGQRRVIEAGAHLEFKGQSDGFNVFVKDVETGFVFPTNVGNVERA